MNKLIRALEIIAAWNSHTTELAVAYGSNGVRDFYRQIAREALTDQKPQYTTTRNAWTGKAIHTCTHCGRDDFRSEHSARFHECKQEPTIDLGKYAGTYGGYIKD